MKKTINNTMLFAATLVLSVFLFTFCTQTVEDPKDSEEIVNSDEILRQFQTVGLLHNEIMDEVLDDFRNHDGHFEDMEGYFDFLEESLVRNLSSKDLLIGMKIEDIQALVVDELVRTRTHYQAHKYKALESESILLSVVSLYEGILSPKQIDILRRVENIIDHALTVDDMIISLEMVNNSPEVHSLDYEDRLVIYAATSVGIESAIYWNANFEKWIEVLMYNDSSDLNFQKVAGAGFFDSIQWFNGRRMINTDVATGVGGAIGGCLQGALAGGVGCIPGGITGGLIGAAVGSTTDAVLQILNR